MRKIVMLSLTLLFSLAMSAADVEPQHVLEQTKKVNAWFVNRHQDPTLPTRVKRVRPSNLWTYGVYFEGLTALNDVEPKNEYIEYIDKWGSFHKWTTRNGVKTTHADDQCCAQTYLYRYLQTKDESMIKEVRANLDNQMATGRVDYWTWIDAIQMAMPVYAQMYKITGERKYMDYAMKAYGWSYKFFNKKDGLWWRDADFMPPYKEKDGNDCYWSRGDGWVYAALVRVMNELEPSDPYYKQLMKDYKLMSKAIIKCQREDGFWNVSLHSPVTYGGKESTGTSLFLYGLSWGLRNGHISGKKYVKSADMAWKALDSAIHPSDGFLGYVQGTGKEPSAGQPVTYDSFPDFEDFGTGCFLLGATEYYKLIKK
jgi:rhamnogalacturonyl hydrolase YesR